MVLPPPDKMNSYLAKQMGVPIHSTPTTTLPPITLPASAPSTRHPLVVPADDFTSASIPTSYATAKVTLEDLNRLRRNPDPLLDGGMFMSGEGEVFKVVSISTIAKAGGRDKLFYVSFADEGPEAVAYEAEHFFNFLSASDKLTL
jgi:hypothetical protein